ncbi:hypothetical protein LguiA_026294 [Lonicera macranthoides]
MGTQLQLLLVVLLILLQLCLMNCKALAQQPSKIYDNETAMTKPGCPFRCKGGSNITIPYPFGIGADCARDETFIITCNNISFNPPRPFIRGIGLEVLSIYLDDGSVDVENPLITSINQNWSSNSSEFPKTYDVTTTLFWITRGTCILLDVQPYGTTSRLYGTTNSCSLNSWCWSKDSLNMATQFAKASVTNFICSCKDGYDGNPYLRDGCQGNDLKKATDRYNKNRIIVQGGRGTVYKGMLTDRRIVAVKVSAKLDEDNLEQFINEILKEGREKEIRMLANLAKQCLNLSGRKRPTMREVTVELEGIRIPNGASTINKLDEKGEYDIVEVVVPSETSLTSRASFDVHPLLIE